APVSPDAHTGRGRSLARTARQDRARLRSAGNGRRGQCAPDPVPMTGTPPMTKHETLDLGSWCILRTASVDTLHLAKSLRDVGLEVWAPVEKKVGRMPRTRTPIDRDVALMPCYAF